jgi:tRNA pseudouridine32 synthase/23S rRNA pseudouridine746 synthase
MTPEEILARVLYRDALMLVIDKPAGLPVHPGPKGGETLHDHLDALRFGLPRRPEVAHRLDRETSGCLVLGRHAKALARLNALFREGAVDKVYWAVVEGGPAEEEGEIGLSLAPRSPNRGWWMKVDPAGQPALTRWWVLGRSCAPHPSSSAIVPSPPLRGSDGEGGAAPAPVMDSGLDPRDLASRAPLRGAPPSLPSPARGERVPGPHGVELGSEGQEAPRQLLTLLELRPVTGRTHQLRVHCAALGWPILGDAIYGTAPRFGGPGLHLHARAVTVPLYPKKPAITVEAPVPAPMLAAMRRCSRGPSRAGTPTS